MRLPVHGLGSIFVCIRVICGFFSFATDARIKDGYLPLNLSTLQLFNFLFCHGSKNQKQISPSPITQKSAT